MGVVQLAKLVWNVVISIFGHIVEQKPTVDDQNEPHKDQGKQNETKIGEMAQY